jgi:GntR family transcriptional regulator
MITVPRASAEPAYRRIAAEWAEAIDNGKFQDGFQLPTRQQLQQQEGVSLQVVRDAFTLLHHEGYLRSEPAKGTFVYRLPRLTLPMYTLEEDDRSVDAFVAIVEEQGRKGRQEIEVSVVRPHPTITAALRLVEDGLALVRRRTRYVDDIPYAIADSYYPHEVVVGSAVADPADITTGLRHVLADLGYPMVRHHDTVVARRPHRREIEALSLAPGLPVIAHNRTSFTADGTAIRVLAWILPSDRWELTYEVRP